jgi:two-component system response regulator YesN
MDKILIVDDERNARNYAGELLRKILPQSQITLQGNPLEALEVFRSRPYDMVLTDISMPEMNGLDLIREILKTETKPFIVIMSAFDAFSFAQQAIDLGASAYLLKPLCLDDMRMTVEKYLHSRSQYRLSVENAAGVHLLRTSDVMAVELEDKYHLTIVAEKKNFQGISGNLTEMAERLPDCFVRINRQCIVNTTYVWQFNVKMREVVLLSGKKELRYICSRQQLPLLQQYIIR